MNGLISIVGAKALILPLVEGFLAKALSNGADNTIDAALADRATSDGIAARVGIKSEMGKAALHDVILAIGKIVEAEGI